MPLGQRHGVPATHAEPDHAHHAGAYAGYQVVDPWRDPPAPTALYVAGSLLLAVCYLVPAVAGHGSAETDADSSHRGTRRAAAHH